MAEAVFNRIAPVVTVHDLDAALDRYRRQEFATELDNVSDAHALHAEWASAAVDGQFIGPHNRRYGLREFVEGGGNSPLFVLSTRDL